MSDNNYLPDQNHIYQIRKRLWSGQEYGNVSVMVGSGFSLNAEKISDSSNSFLTWSELIELMEKDLHPNKDIKATNATSDALKIASEYELVFGRQALNELIMEALPDQNYVPGELHKLLLSLPWSDVFTTNYDTLLERTRPYIYDRKYDLVLTISDISNTMKPRIVKLHGSFPSHRPFIITEEDYRTYPKKNAAFVNMVQQSVMENILCLVGFSGDDPNFLKWIGWVRDNLGNNTPPIYFCGFISSTQKQVLKSRGIIPIDFSPLFPESNFPGVLKYQKALEWFLLNLKYGKKSNPTSWPTFSNNTNKHQKQYLPYIPEGIASYPKENFHRNNFSLNKEELLDLLKKWKKIRLEYPGWIVAPKNCRDKIWTYTENWINPILNLINELPIHKSLFLLYELNWRLEISLKPLFTNWSEKIHKIVEQINPFPKQLEGKNVKCSPETDSSLNWYSIRKCWVKLALALARRAREDQDLHEFNLWMDKLKKVVDQNLEWRANWYYEKSLFYLYNFDQNKLKDTLEKWPESSNKLPFWDVKRASLIAELGDLKDAEKILEDALDKIRFSLKENKSDLSLLSKEGWIMVVLKSLKDNNLNKNEVGEYSERWAKLSEYHCNPWQEIKVMRSILRASVPNSSPENGKSTSKGFDPGKVKKHVSMGNSLKNEVWTSFSFLKMLEKAAVPIKCGRVGFSKEVISCAKWIESYSPLWSLSTMIRAGKPKETHKWFDRVKVANLTDQQVVYFHNLFKPSLEQAIKDPEISHRSNNFSMRILPSLIEITSRLCFRFSNEQRNSLLDLFINIYEKPSFCNFYGLHRYVNRMFERILYAMSDEQIIEKISELLKFPIPGENDFNVAVEQDFVEPFNHINWSEGYTLDKDYDRTSWKESILKLLDIAFKGTNMGRKRALTRLKRLYDINGLDESEVNNFKNAIWAQTDEKTGLPININLYKFAFSLLPGAKENNVKKKLRKIYNNKKIPSLHKKTKGKISYSGGKTFEKYIKNIISSSSSYYLFDDSAEEKYIDWTPKEVEHLFDKVINWWENEKEFVLEKDRINLFENPRNHVRRIVTLIRCIILPNLDSSNKKIKNKVKDFLSELENNNVCILETLPMTLFIKIYSLKEIKNKLRRGLNSSKKIIVKSSLLGCLYWIEHGEESDISSIPIKLLDDWVYKVYNRKNPELDIAIKYIGIALIKMSQKVSHWSDKSDPCIRFLNCSAHKNAPFKLMD